MKFSTLQKDKRQKGMALILAIGFLAILSILGAVVLRVSTRDMQSSAQTRPRQEALYAADRAVEYAMNRDIIMTLAVSGTVDLVDDPVLQWNNTAVPGGVTHGTVINDSGKDAFGNTRGTIISGTVSDLGPRSLPPAMAAIHGSEFGANLYHVSVEATAPLSTQTTHVDASIVRLFKMDDDQIFRTSSGG